MSPKLRTIRSFCSVLLPLGFFFCVFNLTRRNEIKASLFRSYEYSPYRKYITSDGIYPLPPRPSYENKRKKGSVIPQKFFRKQTNISKHNYEWIINPFQTCTAKAKGFVTKDLEEIFLLVAIASASWEFERREIIRNTWASIKQPFGKEVKFVFFVADDNKVGDKIRQEFEHYGDVVMEGFNENYKNLTLKTQGQLKWVTYFCPNARYVMHIDDDVFADINGIVKHLLNQATDRLLHCGKVFMPKVRREGKWKMSPEDYKSNQYPLSCVGWCFVMSQRVANDLYFTSLDTHLIHLEDVTFTGILREKIGDIKPIKIPNGETLCQHLGWPKNRPTNEKLKDAWKTLLENKR